MSKSRREIFEAAWDGLKSQDFRQAMDKNGCQYKTDDGLRCAIGWCMNEEDINQYVATHKGFKLGGTVSNPDVRELAGISYDDKEFALALQSIHDNFGRPLEPELLKQRLIGFAYAHVMEDVVEEGL